MPYVNVDLDDSYPVLLLRVYFNIPRLYPGANVEVYVSPSGVGWHVKTDYKVDYAEYIMSQALLWADPVRTQYALRKLYLNPYEAHLDIMFNEKEGKCETPVPFALILSKYAPDCNQIAINIKEGKYELADKQIKDLAEKIAPELDKYHKKSWVGCVTFNGVELKDDLEKVMLEIAAKDPTFRYRFYPVWWPEFEWMIAVFTDDKDLAWKRIIWLKNNAYKIDSENGNTIMLLKDADTRLFVKERKST
jgi:hypothetical protein